MNSLQDLLDQLPLLFYNLRYEVLQDPKGPRATELRGEIQKVLRELHVYSKVGGGKPFKQNYEQR